MNKPVNDTKLDELYIILRNVISRESHKGSYQRIIELTKQDIETYITQHYYSKDEVLGIIGEDEPIDNVISPERPKARNHLRKQQRQRLVDNQFTTTKKAVYNQIDKVDRFEVIDETGRAYVKGSIYGTPVKVELSYQDGGRTLKVFVEKRLTALKKEKE